MRTHADVDFDSRSLELMGDALLARMRGLPITGAASIYSNCSLATYETLCAIARGLPYGAQLSGSSSDFPRSLADVAAKRAVDHMAPLRSTARAVARKVNLDDFRPTPALALDPPQLERIAEHGPVRGALFGETGESLTLESLGRIIALSRRAITNDDLAALDLIALTAGQSALAAEDDRFVASLTSNPTLGDGVALFHSTHGNLMSAAALNSTTLPLATAALRAQTSSGGVRLNLEPWALLVGPTIEHTALALVATLYTGAPVLQVIVEPRITDNRWYVWCDPSVRAAYGRGYLDGFDQPTIVGQAAWEHEGVDMKIGHLFAVGCLDHRGVVYTPSV